MEKVKIGIIGIGNMGSQHIQFISQLRNCTLTAICDIREDVLERYRDEKSFAKFSDSETFFREADTDAVIIATPHYSHVPLALRALECGKHVIVEKPIAVEKADAERLVAAAPQYPSQRLCAMFCQRTIPAHIRIKRLIDSGELGRIMRVNWIITSWFRTQFYYDSGDWRASWRGEGGGVLLNQCPHQLDLMQWFFGMPERISAHMTFGKYHDLEVEDDVTAYLEYPSGATGVFIASTGEAPGSNRLEIMADRGRVVLENGKLTFLRNETPVSRFCRESRVAFSSPECWDVTIPTRMYNEHMHRDIIENFAESILHNVPLIAPAVEGIRGLELGNAMLLSHLEKRPVELPIDSALFSEHLKKLIEGSRYQKKAPPAKTAAEPPSDFGKSFN